MASELLVRTDAGPEAQGEDIRRVLSTLLGWSGEISLSSIGGGITNLLFKATCSESTQSILVRIFGTGTDLVIDREQDTHTTRLLSDIGFGPHLHGVFDNGRLEEYLEGAVPLTPSDMAAMEPGSDMVGGIAAELARLHCLPVGGGARDPVLWRKIDDFLRLARGVSFVGVDGPAAARAAETIASIDFFRAEADIQWLKDALECASAAALTWHNSTSEGDSTRGCEAHARARAWEIAGRVVFAHNDLLSGNVLRVPTLRDASCEPSSEARASFR